MKHGTLCKINGVWMVEYDKLVHTPLGNHDYKVTRETVTVPTSEQHNLWLIIHGVEGAEFEIELVQDKAVLLKKVN